VHWFVRYTRLRTARREVALAPFMVLPVAMTTTAHAGRNTLKDDKTPNKAMKFASHVIRSIPRGQLDDEFVTRAARLIAGAPDRTKDKVNDLAGALNAKATPAQQAVIAAALTGTPPPNPAGS